VRGGEGEGRVVTLGSGNIWMALFEAGCTCASALAAVYVAFRDSRWRKQGLAAQLSTRIDTAQKTAEGWHETDKAREMRRDIEQNGRDIARHDDALENAVTKADLAKLEGAVNGARDAAKDAKKGVDRIEELLMRRALHPGSN
jgi:hypothetical protein